MIISIDIGTSYSSLSILGPEGKAVPVDISTGASMFGSKYSLPTAVFLDKNETLLLGQAAMNSQKLAPQNFRMEFKRDLGQNTPVLLGGKSFRIEDFYTELFQHMKEKATKLSGEDIEMAYLTCPASYGSAKKERLRQAARAAGLFRQELVDEPTAAAMSYVSEGYIKEGQTLLIYDFGGGTFDVSLLKYEHNSFTLLTEPEGLEHCGGVDMDRMIFQDMLRQVDPDTMSMLKKNNLHFLRFAAQLSELAVKCKHHLSDSENFEDQLQVGFDLIPYTLSREQFNGMIAPLVGKTVEVCRHILEQAKLKPDDLSAVLLVGGSCRIPLVQDMVKQFAGPVPVYCAQNLELAVVQGALNHTACHKDEPAEEPDSAAEKTAAPVCQEPIADCNENAGSTLKNGPLVFTKEQGEFRFALYENGHLEIAGAGELSDLFDTCSPPMSQESFLEKVRSVRISGNVTRIGDGAFSGCSSLTRIELPANTANIGKQVFSNCMHLTQVKLPSRFKKEVADGYFGINSNIVLFYDSEEDQTETAISSPDPAAAGTGAEAAGLQKNTENANQTNSLRNIPGIIEHCVRTAGIKRDDRATGCACTQNEEAILRGRFNISRGETLLFYSNISLFGIKTARGFAVTEKGLYLRNIFIFEATDLLFIPWEEYCEYSMYCNDTYNVNHAKFSIPLALHIMPADKKQKEQIVAFLEELDRQMRRK